MSPSQAAALRPGRNFTREIRIKILKLFNIFCRLNLVFISMNGSQATASGAAGGCQSDGPTTPGPLGGIRSVGDQIGRGASAGPELIGVAGDVVPTGRPATRSPSRSVHGDQIGKRDRGLTPVPIAPRRPRPRPRPRPSCEPEHARLGRERSRAPRSSAWRRSLDEGAATH